MRGTWLAIALLPSAAPALAAQFPNPDLLASPALRFQIVSERTGKLIQKSRIWSEPLERDGEKLINVQAIANLPSGTSVESRTLLRTGATLRPVEVERRVRGADGTILATEMKQVRADALPYAGLTVPDDTYPVSDALLYLLGYLPFDAVGRGSFYVLGEMQAFKLDAWRHGGEDLHVPAGVIACDHMRLRPNAESLNFPALLRPLAALLLPDFDVWTARAAPHFVVRIRGPMGPPGDRDVVLELVGIDAREPSNP